MGVVLDWTKLRWKAEQYGGTTVDESSEKWCVYQCESPIGRLWACSSTHVLRVEWLRGDRNYRNEAILDAMRRMSEGTVGCDNADCDYCCPENN